jgi:hypothetical protein
MIGSVTLIIGGYFILGVVWAFVEGFIYHRSLRRSLLMVVAWPYRAAQVQRAYRINTRRKT